MFGGSSNTAMFFKKSELKITGSPEKMPKHIGIIMDGNGRWAKKRGLPRTAGHAAGSGTFKNIATFCNEIGIECLTVYAFSTENWKRPQNEIDAIIKLLDQYLDDAFSNFSEENIRLRFIGDISPLPGSIREKVERMQRQSADRTGMILNIAFNYGGQAEIVHAVNEIIGEMKDKTRALSPITKEDIEQRLYTAGCPKVDLIIRPSGEKRLSNFLLWESAYCEFWFSDVLWPDFKRKHLVKAINDYIGRDRRFGGV